MCWSNSTSKLGVLRWLEGARVPAVDSESVTHQRLLRAMDTLAERADAMQRTLAVLLRPLIDQELSVVFYELTAIGVEGQAKLPADVRACGKSKDGGIARQFMLGLVQTAEGFHIAHRVWEGNTAETTTLQPVIEEVLTQFPVRRVVLVAGRGLLNFNFNFTHEQSAGVAQVGDAVGQMDRATQQNAALVQQSATAAGELQDQAQQLVHAVAVFRLGAPAAH